MPPKKTGRPRRSTTSAPATPAAKNPVATPGATTASGKKRGRPAKAVEADAEAEEQPARKRGRPASNKLPKEVKPKNVDEPVKAAGKRGRPSKASGTAPTAVGKESKKTGRVSEAAPKPGAVEATPKKRGRPPKAEKAVEKPTQEAVVPKASSKKRGRPSQADAAEKEDPPKKRGRTSKAEATNEKLSDEAAKVETAPAVPKKATAPPRKRGRPPHGGETTKISVDDTAAAEQLEEELKDTAEEEQSPEEKTTKAKAPASKAKKAEAAPEKKTSTTKGKPKATGEAEAKKPVGRPKGKAPAEPKEKASKAKPNAKKEATISKAADADVDTKSSAKAKSDLVLDANGLEVTESGKHYWLMKAEQDDREETTPSGKPFNTKFTIDDLIAKGGPEPWDGVRNPSAAKNMRSMKRGDLAFFYASNGKAGRKPGIVGIMEVVKEHEPDPSTSDKDHYAYVEKEADRKKWCIVHVEFRKKFSKPVHLSELQKFGKENGVLSDMDLLRLARLSVCKVKEKEWDFINQNLVQGFEKEIQSFPATSAAAVAQEALQITGVSAEDPTAIAATTEAAKASSVLGAIPALVERATEIIKDAAVAAIPALEEVLPMGETSVPDTGA